MIAYGYYGYPGFVILTWTLLSFIAPMVGFVKWSTRLYLPVFMVAFFYEYLINVQGLFTSAFGIFRDVPRYWDKEKTIRFDIHPFEICGMVTNILFMITLISQQDDLSRQRNEFKENLFGKMADEKRNFLWQLSFYVLKRCHIILLSAIFLLGMNDINIYYIGLLYFFIRYISSLHAYRKCGHKLVSYASFFIWIIYIWNYVKGYFDINGYLYKLFSMLTLGDYEGDKEIAGTEKINELLQTPIPFGMWIVLLLNVLMRNINKLFKSEEERLMKLPESKRLAQPKVREASYYEEKIEQILTKKFPTLAKVFIRVSVFLSEMMILALLIVQTLVLAFQKPNLMYWGFLICSLILQAIVIAYSYGKKGLDRKVNTDTKFVQRKATVIEKLTAEEKAIRAQEEIEKKLAEEQEEAKKLRDKDDINYKKFIFYSTVLKNYSGIVLIA